MGLDLVESIVDLRAMLARGHSKRPLGLVPTMGALHAGHASLIERARRECASVVVSVFVNPLQFDRPADLDLYPRSLDADAVLCRSLGVDVLFAPSVQAMYPIPQVCFVEVGHLADRLCGRFRPGHFKGVATVVLKLFEIVRPDVAYFGEKDAQQLAIVRRLVADLNVPVGVVGVPTVREPDGLAVSSRNIHLGPAERPLAPALYQALEEIRRGVAEGETDPSALAGRGRASIPSSDLIRLEYLEIVDPDEFQPVDRVRGPVVAAGALWVGQTRLIDNIFCTPGGR
jgi:pantoate--beta-alanine ligase